MKDKISKILYSRLTILTLIVIALIGIASCTTDNPDPTPEPTPSPTETRTLFFFLPYSENLMGFFQNNVTDLETAIQEHGLQNQRVFVFLSGTSSQSDSELFEIILENNQCVRKTVNRYANYPYRTVEGITKLLETIKDLAPADRYSMIIGSHGMGWIPVSGTSPLTIAKSGAEYHFQFNSEIVTRWFGGSNIPKDQTNISDLAKAIEDAGMHMEFIMFDDCYMANVEVAYDLRNVADHLIGSTCEIMGYGMPYHKMGKYLLGEPDYPNIVKEFLDFYSNYSYPYGTIAAIDCSQIEGVVREMKKLNDAYTFDQTKIQDIQFLDGYTPDHTFFDFGDYCRVLSGSTDIPAEMTEALDKLIVAKANTPNFFSTYGSFSGNSYPIRSFSGVTVSDPSISNLSAKKEETGWWKATH